MRALSIIIVAVLPALIGALHPASSVAGRDAAAPRPHPFVPPGGAPGAPWSQAGAPPEVMIVTAAEPEGEGTRWGGDILAADQATDTEGYLDMVCSASGRYFLVTESMNNTCVNVFRSDNGGMTWWKWLWVCGAGANDVTGASVAIPEYSEDYLYLAYLYGGSVWVTRVEVQTGGITSYAVDSDAGDQGLPRITTDDIDYPDYYVYLIYGGARIAVSTDRAADWSRVGSLHPSAMQVACLDIDYAADVLYATWWYLLPGGAKDAGERVPWGTATRRSTDYGSTWSATTSLCEDCENGRVGAIENSDEVVIVYTKGNGADEDVRYAYSGNQGASWTLNQCLDCSTPGDAIAPDISVDLNGGYFRVAYRQTGGDIVYRKAPASNPTNWSSPRVINDTHQASAIYTPPSVAVPPSGSAGVAWCDERTPTRAIYFDREGAGRYRINAAGTGDLPTIQAALNVAASGDTIDLEDGVYRGAGNRDIDPLGKGVLIRSLSGNPSACVIDCQGSASEPHRGFYMHSGEGAASRLLNLKIINAYVNSTAAGIYLVNSSPVIEGCVISGCSAMDGGAIAGVQSNVVISGCRFESNVVSDAGGALLFNQGWPTIQVCTFEGNSAVWGGGAIYLDYSQPSITSCLFHQNSSEHWGGAIHNRYESCDPLINYCTFYENTAAYGGAVYNRTGADPRLVNCTFYGNSASQSGGGVHNAEAGTTVTLERTLITCQASGGAATCASGGAASATCCDIYGNAGGDWTGCLAGQDGVGGNFSSDPILCNAPGGDFGLDDASPCAPGNNGCGVLIGAHGVTCTGSGVSEWEPETPGAFLGIAPNPSRGGVELAYTLPGAAEVELSIFDPRGRRIRRLIEGRRISEGAHRISWDGRDGSGHAVSSGIYLVRLRTGSTEQRRALVLIR